MNRTISGALLAALSLFSGAARAAAPAAREPLSIREPGWKGSTPGKVTAEYREALAGLQAIAASHPEGAPMRVSAPVPCVLRLERGHDVAAFGDASKGFLHQVTWIDLAAATQVEAQAFGRRPSARPSMAATCAWLTGAAGFALSTEVVALAGKAGALRRNELTDEEQPRLCVASEVEPEELAKPLKALVQACGGGSPGR